MDISASNKRNKKFTNDPTVTIDLSKHGRINWVYLAPYEWCQELIFIAFHRKLLVAQLSYNNSLELNDVIEIKEEVQTAIALSPDTTINAVPSLIKFCVASGEFEILVCTADLDGNVTTENLSGHTDYINDLCYDHDNNFIISVSDDMTARVWDIQSNQCSHTYSLSSPGVAVQCHRDDGKLLIAEKSGVIRFYNVHTHAAIFSIDCGKMLSGVHWAPSDSAKLATLSMGEVSLWLLARTSCATYSKLIFTEFGGHVKFSPQGEYLALTNSLEGYLKIIHVNTQQQKISAKLKLLTNPSWHYKYPLLCVPDGGKLNFWKL